MTGNIEPTPFPQTTDPIEATAILARLQEKKEAGILCLYPSRLNPRQLQFAIRKMFKTFQKAWEKESASFLGG